MKHNLKWVLFMFVSFLSYQANATRYYVDASRPDNSGDGLSWATAKKDLQEAINVAANTTDEIWVKNGTYKPTLAPDGTTSDADIRLRTFTFKPLSIYGGFAGTETMLSQRVLNINACKLSGAVGTLGTNCYNVGIYVNTSQMLVLDGFTIEGGISSSTSATRSPAAFNSINISYGAGLNITGWATLRNLIFRNNSSSSGRGGALFMSGYVPNGVREITRCAFVGNSSASGGAIQFETASSNAVILSNSLFHGNICTGSDGGGAIFAFASILRLVNNTFVNNQASNTFSKGGAILFRLGTQYSLYNNVFKGNSTATGGSTGVGCDIASPGYQIPTVDAQNNFLQGQASNYDTPSDVNGEIVVGTGNLFAQFLALVDANTPYGADGQIFTADDGCQLYGSNNLCANSNLVNALVPTIDARGLNRVCYADMGAYENQYEINTPPTVACNGGNACLGGGFLFVPTGANIYNYDKQTGPLTWTNVATAQSNYLASPNDTTNYRIIGIDVEGCRDTAYATVTVSYPDVEVEFTDVACYGQNTGEITLTPYVGSATPYTYAWSDDPNETGNTRSGLIEGTYDVTMTDANGCIGMETVIISQPSSPLAVSVTGVNNNYCYGEENGGVNLYATGGTTSWPVEYIYTSSANAETSVGAGGYLNGLMAGNYTAYVTDMNGCTASVPFSVTSPAQIVSSFNAVAFNTYSWNGQNYTASGTYEQVFIAISSGEAFCDSTVTLNLIITTVAGDQDGDGTIGSGEISGDTNGNGSIDGNETTGDANGDGTIGSGEVSGDSNGNGIIDGTEVAGDANGDGTIGSGEVSGDSNGNGIIDGTEVAGDANGDGTIGSGEVSGDSNGNGIIDGTEVAGDANGDGTIGSGEVSGDSNGNGIIDGTEVAGDANGDGTIGSGEVSGDSNGNGIIDGSEVAGDANGDGTIGSGEVSGDTNGNGIIDGNETTGDANGDGTIGSGEVSGDSNGNGIIDGTEVTGDANGDGTIGSGEVSGDSNGNGIIDGTEVTGDANGDGTIGSGEVSGDSNGNGIIDGTEVAGDANGDGTIGSGEVSGDSNGNGIIDGNETTGDTNGDGSIGSGEVSGDSNGNGSIDGNETTGDTNGDGTIGSGEVSGDSNGNGIIDGNETTGDANGDGTIGSGEVSGDSNGNGIIDGSEVAGDANGDGTIGSGEVSGDSNGNGSIDGNETTGDTNGDGTIGSGEVSGDSNGNGIIDGNETTGDTNGDGTIGSGEVSGDSNGNGIIDGTEVAGDANGDGTIGSGEVSGDSNGNGIIDGSEVAGDTNGDGNITDPEIIGDTNGNGVIDNGEIAGDANGNGVIDSGELASLFELPTLKVSIAPNPTTGEISVKFNASKALVTIKDVNGKFMHSTTLLSGEVLNFEAYQAGVYFVEVNTSFGTKIERIVKQ